MAESRHPSGLGPVYSHCLIHKQFQCFRRSHLFFYISKPGSLFGFHDLPFLHPQLAHVEPFAVGANSL